MYALNKIKTIDYHIKLGYVDIYQNEALYQLPMFEILE